MGYQAKQVKYSLLRNLFWLASLLFLYPIPLVGESPSLFFTEKEIHLIKQKFLFQNEVEKIDKKLENIYLSAIIYVDESHWTLWANQQAVHALNPHPIDGYNIEKVTPHAAVFSYIPSNSTASKKFTLPLHHMFLSAENKIIKINE